MLGAPKGTGPDPPRLSRWGWPDRGGSRQWCPSLSTSALPSLRGPDRRTTSSSLALMSCPFSLPGPGVGDVLGTRLRRVVHWGRGPAGFVRPWKNNVGAVPRNILLSTKRCTHRNRWKNPSFPSAVSPVSPLPWTSVPTSVRGVLDVPCPRTHGRAGSPEGLASGTSPGKNPGS